jgi:hypothetical protein
MYPSPSFQTSHNGHESPISSISPLHSMHNSPKAIRSVPDTQGLVTYPVRKLVPSTALHRNRNRHHDEIIKFKRATHLNQNTNLATSDLNALPPQQKATGPQVSPKRRSADDKTPEASYVKRKPLKPRRLEVTAIQKRSKSYG